MKKGDYEEKILEAKNNIIYYSKKLSELRVELIKVQKDILLNKARLSIDLYIEEYINLVNSYNAADNELLTHLFQKEELNEKHESLKEYIEELKKYIERENNKNAIFKLFNSKKLSTLNNELAKSSDGINECIREIEDYEAELLKYRINKNDLAKKVLKVCDFFSITFDELKQVIKMESSKEYYNELLLKEAEILKLIDETKGWIKYNRYKIEEYKIGFVQNDDASYYHNLRAKKLAERLYKDDNKKYQNPGLNVKEAEKAMEFLKMEKAVLKEIFETSYLSKDHSSDYTNYDIISHTKRVQDILNLEYGKGYNDKANPGTDVSKYLRKMELLKMPIEEVINIHSSLFGDNKDSKQLIK